MHNTRCYEVPAEYVPGLGVQRLRDHQLLVVQPVVNVVARGVGGRRGKKRKIITHTGFKFKIKWKLIHLPFSN